MLDYIESAFARTDLRQIRSFIMHGTEELKVGGESYKARLDHCDDAIIKRLEGTYTDNAELDKAFSDLGESTSTHQEVYMELGMKIGARLLYQLLISEEGV
jgi:hypothetical protein